MEKKRGEFIIQYHHRFFFNNIFDYFEGNYNKHGNRPQKQPQEIDETNPIMKMFKDFSIQLDEKHDRYERIVKLSRDITIESKRIIFLLHNQDTDM